MIFGWSQGRNDENDLRDRVMSSPPSDEPRFELTLFVCGASDLSARTIADARELCELHLDGRYSLPVLDVSTNPAAASRSGVIAPPTLAKNLPLPERRYIGDLARTDKVLTALELPDSADAPTLGD